MGHYDSCREADERHEEEKAKEAALRATQKKGANLREILLSRTDEEIGQFAEAYETIDKISRDMSGKEKQHDGLKVARGFLSRFFTKQEKKMDGRWSFDDHHIGWLERDSGGALKTRIIENPGLRGTHWYGYAQIICDLLNRNPKP